MKRRRGGLRMSQKESYVEKSSEAKRETDEGGNISGK